MGFRIDEAKLKALFPEIDEISDPRLRAGVVAIWKRTAEKCEWDSFEDVPKNLSHERYRRLTDHVRGVTRMAMALAEIAADQNGTPYNRDHLIAACLLHDVSKPLEMSPDPDGEPTGGPARPARKSKIGKALQHAAYATHEILVEDLPLEIAHLVLTHTHESNMRSHAIEAAYLFYADYADSDAGIAPTGGRAFAERWHLTA